MELRCVVFKPMTGRGRADTLVKNHENHNRSPDRFNDTEIRSTSHGGADRQHMDGREHGAVPFTHRDLFLGPSEARDSEQVLDCSC